MEENQDKAAPEQGSAQPEAGTAPTKSAAEIKLEKQLADAKTAGEGYKKERDTARKDLAAVTKERDKATADVGTALATITAQNEELSQLKQSKADPSQGSISAAAEQQPDEHAETKELLRRFGLPCAWVLPDGQICFEKSHAKHVAGQGFDSLTVISAE